MTSGGSRTARADNPQHRYDMGRDKAYALIRGLGLERAWSGVERLRQAKGTEHEERIGRQFAQSPKAVWDETTMAIAQAVARGGRVVHLPPPIIGMAVRRSAPDHGIDAAAVAKRHPDAVASWLRDLRPDFPDIRIELADPAIQEQAEAVEAERVEEARRVVAGSRSSYRRRRGGLLAKPLLGTPA